MVFKWTFRIQSSRAYYCRLYSSYRKKYHNLFFHRNPVVSVRICIDTMRKLSFFKCKVTPDILKFCFLGAVTKWGCRIGNVHHDVMIHALETFLINNSSSPLQSPPTKSNQSLHTALTVRLVTDLCWTWYHEGYSGRTAASYTCPRIR